MERYLKYSFIRLDYINIIIAKRGEKSKRKMEDLNWGWEWIVYITYNGRKRGRQDRHIKG